MSKEDVIVRQTVRFPKNIHESVEAVRGQPGKPRASFNDTLLYLVREGLKATGHELPIEFEELQHQPAFLSEPAFAESWNRPEEDEAWEYLRDVIKPRPKDVT